MSTSYYAICENCLAGEKHLHRLNDAVVAESYYGDEAVGTVVSIIDGFDDPYVMDEYDNVHTLEEVRRKRGAGKKGTIPKAFAERVEDTLLQMREDGLIENN